MIEFEVFVNQEFVYTQRSDGLIVSTPTGSTAYSLAAGGPIMQAGLHAFTLVPICPQSMTNRPIAIPDTSEIEILVTQGGDARVHFDGQSFIDVQTSTASSSAATTIPYASYTRPTTNISKPCAKNCTGASN
ncbi:inorganic polyphosphate/ATP-NAD kinase [Neisseria gonorrhoeae]|uniref:Inorganic polyphosphate/ATP-NAD kinase n=1 Tax=Neisseria gonorrhoeae TaxID=485 RepID=A0A378W126_NEIGO|nr:inorganic polyphosphate/ATP-NAD kinase [Neisseria gonorrhoeae]